MAERHGAGGDDAVPGADHRDPYAGYGGHDRTLHDPYGEQEPWYGAGTEYHEPGTEYHEPGTAYYEPEPPSGAVVAQHRAVPHSELRADFGAHLETHYPRLVAQLYAITLHPGDAHDAVQDAYSRAWRRWSELRSQDSLGWVRRVAIRTSMRGWRPGLTRAGLRRSRLPAADALDPDTASLLQTLSGLPIAVRRAVVLRHMAGLPLAEIAELERISEQTLRERLRRGRTAVREGMDQMLGHAAGAVEADEGSRTVERRMPRRGRGEWA